MNKRAVVLISGGLDSTTTLAIAMKQGYECYALSFDYGQRAKTELMAAQKNADILGAKAHKILPLPLDYFGASALTDLNIAVPEKTPEQDEIPITYVPARNTIFLSCALAYAEIIEAEKIFLGINSVDYANYCDCRPDYLEAFEKMANLATKRAIEGHKISMEAPLLHLNKAQIIQKGVELGIDYSFTISCYQADEDGRACGKCSSCQFRKKGFEEANIPDPTRYRY